MGGRGASSGMSDKGIPYGTEYHSILTVGNIKFVKKNEGAATAPLETMTQGRIYVLVNDWDEVKAITFYDTENKKYKQIDVSGRPHSIHNEKVLPHTHFGYEHDEGGTDYPSSADKDLIDKVLTAWYNHFNK